MTSAVSLSSDSPSASTSASPTERPSVEGDTQNSPRGTDAEDDEDASDNDEPGDMVDNTELASELDESAEESRESTNDVVEIIPQRAAVAALSTSAPSTAAAATTAKTTSANVLVPSPRPPMTSTPTSAPIVSNGTTTITAASAPLASAPPASPTQTPSSAPSHKQNVNSTIIQFSPAFVDGRVRNVTPSKLLGRTKNTDGNFSVMHMDVPSNVMTARDLAAQRTSELTKQAAEAASRNGYQSIKRSKLVWLPPSPVRAPLSTSFNQQSTQQTMQRPPFQSQSGHQRQQFPQPQQAQHPPPSSLGPSPAEVKAEQARLLTFLRSLHPIMVVDQLCKGLAYFGGVPSAPPPENGVFPSSEKNNGSGAVFVGWLSEIFPPADIASLPIPDHAAVAMTSNHGETSAERSRAPDFEQSDRTNTLVPRRKRGRPKGSKGTKARKDKGIKKGPKNQPAASTAIGQQSTITEGDNNERDRHTAQPADIDAATSSTALPRSTPPPTSGAASSRDAVAPEENQVSTPSTAGKKRGRPPGSRNRPRREVTAHAIGPQPISMRPPPLITGLSRPVEFVNDQPANHGPPSSHVTQESPQYHSPYNEDQSQPTHHEGGLSQHARIWAQPPAPDTLEPNQPHLEAAQDDNAHGTSRKRKANDNPQLRLLQQAPEPVTQGQAAVLPAQTQQAQSRPDAAAATQAATSKRRRVSKEANPKVSMTSTGSQSSGTDMSASPVVNQRQPTRATSTHLPANLSNHGSENTPTSAQVLQLPDAPQSRPRNQPPQTALRPGQPQQEQTQQAQQDSQPQQASQPQSQQQQTSLAQQSRYPPYYKPQSPGQAHIQSHANHLLQPQYKRQLQPRPIPNSTSLSPSQPYQRPPFTSSAPSPFQGSTGHSPTATSGQSYQQPYTQQRQIQQQQQSTQQQQQQRADWSQGGYPLNASGGAAAAAATLGNQVRQNQNQGRR